MEAVLHNLSCTVQLLAVAAHSHVVQAWDAVSLSRSFHWASYCQHIFSRFHRQPAIRRLMEQQLELTNHSLQAAIPEYTPISFLQLHHCQHLLLNGLLNNPALPSSILKILFQHTNPADAVHGEYEDVTGLCSSIVQCRSACKVLNLTLCDLSAEAEVQGVMLMERLEILLSVDAGQAEQCLNLLLQGSAETEQRFCEVIAAALLTKTNSPSENSVQDFLLAWLQSRPDTLQLLCSVLPGARLADLATRHQEFSETYCGLLKKWASNMEYSLSDEEWVQTGAENRTVTFQDLTEHFLILFRARPALRVDVERELQDLKVSDGDFDVRGLSVWGDLLSAFESCRQLGEK